MLRKSSAKFLLQERPLPGSLMERSILDEMGNFRRRISFEIYDWQFPISIQLQEETFQPSSISGYSFSIEALVSAQQLKSSFGRSDQVKRKKMDSMDALTRKRQLI